MYNYRFPGQYFDAETGTHYNYFRDYEAETGRYLQSDPIGLEDGPNPFIYIYNAPIDYFDIDGLSRKSNKGRVIILLCQLWANMEDLRNPDFDVKGDRGGNPTTQADIRKKLPKPKPKNQNITTTRKRKNVLHVIKRKCKNIVEEEIEVNN